VDLPEGTVLEVDLRPADTDDGIPPEERKHVLHAIDEGLAAARRGEHVDAEEFVNELLAEP
jgi:predicted transcriptional regulator